MLTITLDMGDASSVVHLNNGYSYNIVRGHNSHDPLRSWTFLLSGPDGWWCAGSWYMFSWTAKHAVMHAIAEHETEKKKDN